MQEDFHRPEIPLENTREIDNEARISKKAEIKRKFNRNQKRITSRNIQLSCLTSLLLRKSDFFPFLSLAKIKCNFFIIVT